LIVPQENATTFVSKIAPLEWRLARQNRKSVPPTEIGATQGDWQVPPTEIGATQSDWHKVIGATQGNWWSYGDRWAWMSNSTSVREGKSMVICG